MVLTSYPKPATAEDYSRAADEIAERLRGLPGLVAIYRAGGVTVPGISDLDYVAVLESGGHVPSIWHDLPAAVRDLALHSPFAVDAATFEKHRWFAHLEPLRLVEGRSLEPEASPMGDYGRLLLATESLVLNFLRVVKRVHTGHVRVRSTLCELHTIKYGLTLAGLDEGQAPLAWTLSREIADLRQGWFEPSGVGTRDIRLRAAIDKSVAALSEALAVLGLQLRRFALYPEEQEPLFLNEPWSNVVLRAKHDTSSGNRRGHPQLPPLLSPFRRLSELRWRVRRHRVAIPAELLALLRSTRPEGHVHCRAERDRLVRAYSRFLREQAMGYSAIGFALPFVSR